jgi:hypothetical protein
MRMLATIENKVVAGRDAVEGGPDHCRRHHREVTFELVDGAINNEIDDAYRAKYKGSPYLRPMIGTHARSATVKVRPSRDE